MREYLLKEADRFTAGSPMDTVGRWPATAQDLIRDFARYLRGELRDAVVCEQCRSPLIWDGTGEPPTRCPVFPDCARATA